MEGAGTRVAMDTRAETVLCCGQRILAAAVLTEDPPFGGLWCDQPAPFSGILYLVVL